VASTVTAAAWTVEDRALMLGWRMYLASLHEPCGHPKETAFHPDNEGWFEPSGWITCWACTAGKEPDKDGRVTPVRFPVVVDTRDYERKPLPPWPDLTDN
jgi:hypothetical protein